MRLLSSGERVHSNAGIDSVLDGGAPVSSIGGGAFGTTVKSDAFPTMVRLPKGEELVTGALFDPSRSPGCIGGVAPEQFWINERSFALFHISPETRRVVITPDCKLDESPAVFATRVQQMLPQTGDAFQRSDGTIYMPILKHSILILRPQEIQTGPIAGGAFHVIEMTQRPESEWRYLPSFLGTPKRNSVNGRIDYRHVFRFLERELRKAKSREHSESTLTRDAAVEAEIFGPAIELQTKGMGAASSAIEASPPSRAPDTKEGTPQCGAAIEPREIRQLEGMYYRIWDNRTERQRVPEERRRRTG